jgi:hypothetical protein
MEKGTAGPRNELLYLILWYSGQEHGELVLSQVEEDGASD